MGVCAECGTAERDGRSCREQWDEFLALEFSDVRAGQVHFLTVSCYQLQHPASWSLDEGVRNQLLESLRLVMEDNIPVEEIRRQMGERYEGAHRVVGTDAPDVSSPRTWSYTVADVGPPDARSHADRIRTWARAVIDDLIGQPP